MKYELFKEKVRNELREYLPKELENCMFTEKRVLKVNRTLDGLVVSMPEPETADAEREVSPTFYYDEIYARYQEGTDFAEILKGLAECITNTFERIKSKGYYGALSGIKECLTMNIINTEKNRELLSDIPHKEVLDLSVIYRCILQEDTGNGELSVIVNNDLAERFNLTAQLHRLAEENLRNQIEIHKINPFFYILTNRDKMWGAAAMVMEEWLAMIAEEMHSDLYILPSSVHEVILLAEEDAPEPETISDVIREANLTVVREADILSYSLYRYDRGKRSLEIVRVRDTQDYS